MATMLRAVFKVVHEICSERGQMEEGLLRILSVNQVSSEEIEVRIVMRLGIIDGY
jgi:hypothetical protein